MSEASANILSVILLLPTSKALENSEADPGLNLGRGMGGGQKYNAAQYWLSTV